MKRIFTILLLLVGLGLSAQNYNNEWIDYSKTYYKFKVGITGLHRIPQSLLVTAGLQNTPVQNFQLFRNGQEIPIYTTVAAGLLGTSDYIEFWGKANDGVPDLPLYAVPTSQHTDHWSLETDTAVYFLTTNSTGATFHYSNTVNDTTGTPLTPEPYFLHKAATYFKTMQNLGFAQIVGEYIYSSTYDPGEFWSSGFIYPGAPLLDAQANLYVYPSGPDATLRFGMAGCADNNRSVQVSVNSSTLLDTVMNSFADLQSTKPVPLSLITSNSASIQFTNFSPPPAITTDRVVASFYELTYPRQFNFGGQGNFVFDLPAKGSGFFLKITNFNNITGITPVLYDLSNGLRYTAITGPGSTLSFLLGGSGVSRKMVLVNENPATVDTIKVLTTKNFVNYANSANQGNYLIISSPQLYTGSSGNNPVLDYRSYRSSPEGGSYAAQVYDISDLVDQFGFGIKKHPLSVLNFLRYARAVFVAKPQFVLLIGHGMTYVDYYQHGEIAKDPLADKLNIIPTFGTPASDNKLSAANSASAVPVTPIGRLSVVLGVEVENYLAKVKDYEKAQSTAANTIDGRLWMKNALHLTGVSEPYLGTIICNYMYGYQQIIDDTSFGANVLTFCDGNASQVSQAPDAVAKIFSNGFGMLNYFGHSSNTTLAYNLNNPSDYNNQGKYPVFYVNGCDAGNFFIYDNQRFAGANTTISESYVLAKDRGSIAFVASTHFGIVNYLNILLGGLYNLIAGADYGKPIGIIQKDAIQALINATPGDYFGRLHGEQMTTHGDPALRLNQQQLPDYDVEASQVVINPSFVSIADNSFNVKARIFNLGKAVRDSITIVVKRQYPDGSSVILLTKKMPGIDYEDSVQLAVPIFATKDKGQNYITVTVTSTVPEVVTSNNSITTSVYIYQDAATPVYPYNYAIINLNRQKLYASTADAFSPSQQYVMEIDTTTLFNSSTKVSKNLISVGGVLEFDPGITYQDSVVYYWRVATVPATGSQYIWNGASFVYIDSLRSTVGMNQSHFYQHTVSISNNIFLDTASRRWLFDSVTDNLYIRIGTWPTSTGQEQGVSVGVNGNQYLLHNACAFSSIIFNVFDPVTFRPWLNTTNPSTLQGLYGSVRNDCSPGREYSFEFPYTDTSYRRKLANFMDMIPAGAIVVARSFMVDPVKYPSYLAAYATDFHADTVYWGAGNSVYNRFLNQGFAGIDSFSRPRNFSFIYKKDGADAFAPRWIFTLGTTDNTSLSVDVRAPDTTGYILSPAFGPAKQWNQLHWRGQSLEGPSADTASVQVFGIDTLNNATLLYSLSNHVQDYDISAINAKQYPYVQLKMLTSDTVTGTPYQLKYWRLNYMPVPEGALAPNIFLKVKDTLQLGETLEFAIAFKNISPYAFDSMRIKMYILDRNNVSHPILLPKKRPLISGDTLTLSYTIDTKTYAGANTIYVSFNPDNDQPEQYTFNNFLYKGFFVKSENRNPLLDVTFDNVHILNDDIVSAKPHIQIKLKSLAQYLLLTDTSLIRVQLKYPDGSLHPYSFNTDTLRFTPASSTSDNTATVDFTPVFSKQINADGDDYQLIVTGKDESGNTTGTIPYRISFKVITKAMISNMLNYPNPFTTSTAFVFTITGFDVPQNIKIQILTITGKIVREITKDELGPLHVGRNITEFKWNGTDAYGQRLANGVYLYHVVTNLNGKTLDKYKASSDNTDQFFNNGYGKMYLMR
ncbi:MAG TPA: C25 family cysteine peptidase [Puia sp.]|nr:C25 family cysteine peptidase [Puia sp.]